VPNNQPWIAQTSTDSWTSSFPGQSLRDAQQNKVATLARNVRLCRSDHVLELGCGWGGFALYAAETYGCRVTGITLSAAQHALATARVAAAGLESLVDIQLCDYRAVQGSFTKLVSIEMLEAVGREYWGEFFRTCDRLLRPGGLAGIQVITVADRDFAEHAGQSHWVQKYIFPGGLLPSLLELCQAMSATSPLGVYHLEDIGEHYATTIERWRTAFKSQLPRVRALGFDERFIRMWEFYLAACQARFATRTQHALQLVLARPGAIAP
jgi:cyclopropane-fatty-acyl-phospholipid synthase